MKKINSILVVVLILVLGGFASATNAENKGGLFVNLTTDDTWAAAKAILFAHEKVLKLGNRLNSSIINHYLKTAWGQGGNRNSWGSGRKRFNLT